MAGTIPADVESYMRRVKDTLNQVRRTTSWHGFDQIERDLGLDQLVENQTVTVTFSVPADGPEAAARQVEHEVGRYRGYLPAGWDVSVSA